ncbi:hypothetical protein BS50DRAFT_210800 [Corynespora cassiicola Philippines]|uniref:Protein kinase domain-containing protein n=1 Tax=Corynespora cassiicola Philippines TaxID=1448308 RepID=A0A2T2N3Y9_CORCC|nr:hypothetical protein BS50DRAFT_210800 [Corynespora cassiicola Philippines]
MGRPLRVSIPHTSRSFRYRFLFVIFFLALFQQQRLLLLYRDALYAKYLPTRFPSNVEEYRPRLLRPDDEDAQFQDELLSNRKEWKILGQGFEGRTYTYHDSVIKTFTPGKSPFRNCAPGSSYGKWPTEIPASLYFGGSFTAAATQHANASSNANSASVGFLPVKAYFMATSSPAVGAEWHLVTPLVPGGNLNGLAKRIHRKRVSRSAQELDIEYRPVFVNLLNTLDSLHNDGYCHDDIKPSNIFVEDDLHWVVGDLGNVREISHPYHYSKIWKNNNQLEDCRANDVMRALKSYLLFLRSASEDTASFNRELFEGQTPWSRLFWWASADSLTMTVAELRVRSVVESPLQEPRDASDLEGPPSVHSICPFWKLFGSRFALSRAAHAVLPVSNSEKFARWASFSWFSGVPVSNECGYTHDD